MSAQRKARGHPRLSARSPADPPRSDGPVASSPSNSRAAAGAEVAWTSALMLSELATNAVQHADTEFEVDIDADREAGGRWVRVRVTDEAAGLPHRPEPPPDAPHGRGLRIVETLADAWGVDVRRDRSGQDGVVHAWRVAAGRRRPVLSTDDRSSGAPTTSWCWGAAGAGFRRPGD